MITAPLSKEIFITIIEHTAVTPALEEGEEKSKFDTDKVSVETETEIHECAQSNFNSHLLKDQASHNDGSKCNLRKSLETRP